MKKIKVFISSGYRNRYVLRFALNFFREHFRNLKFTSDWIYSKSTNFKKDVDRDLNQLKKSDLILSFYPWGYGTLCELSYALGIRKNIIVLVDEYEIPDKLDKIPIKDWSIFYPLSKMKMIKSSNDLEKIMLNKFRIVVKDTDLFIECLKKFIELKNS